MIATAMSVYGNVSKAQHAAQTKNLITEGQESTHHDQSSEVQTPSQAEAQDGQDEAQARRNAMQQSVLESFDRTKARH
jgi:hypothetical protein